MSHQPEGWTERDVSCLPDQAVHVEREYVENGWTRSGKA